MLWLLTDNKKYFYELSRWFNLDVAFQTNGVTESNVKEVIKKQFGYASKY